MFIILSRKIIHVWQKVKKFGYKNISDINIRGEKYVINQPLMTRGKGLISLGRKVKIGFEHAPYFYSNYSVITAYTADARVTIGDNTQINNCVTIYANSGEISIGKDVLIGHCVEILNTDFHYISPTKRHLQCLDSKDINIGDNVFIGSHSRILKGVTIGKDSVIAAGSVVTKSVPEKVIYGGVPARLIQEIDE